MSADTWTRWAGYRPESAAGWVYLRTRAEILTELELCGVPVDATPDRTRCLLETNGVWTTPSADREALRYRRERVSVLSGHADR
ncbi:hypothetical protein ACWDXH_14265 [Micromonospora chokoriensis]